MFFALALNSYHPHGANFALGDGSVRFVSDSVGLDVYRAAHSVAGGEPFTLP
jgi:prepilin-type processing-associated H-X9-DG protein